MGVEDKRGFKAGREKRRESVWRAPVNVLSKRSEFHPFLEFYLRINSFHFAHETIIWNSPYCWRIMLTGTQILIEQCDKKIYRFLDCQNSLQNKDLFFSKSKSIFVDKVLSVFGFLLNDTHTKLSYGFDT